jgi:hypothetical protein
MVVPQINKKTGKYEELAMSSAEYDAVFNLFYSAQPENLTERQIYRDIVDNLEHDHLKKITPDLIADYAKYQVLRQAYVDGVKERFCPHCDKPYKLTSLHKRSYDEITIALMRLIYLSVDEAEVDFNAF